MVGTVQALWRFPVKSMQGEQLAAAQVSARGFTGDRAYGLLDVHTGTIASAKRVKQFPDLMACRARFVEPPRSGQQAPPVCIDLPDGTCVRSDSHHADRALSAYFGRELRLVRAGPEMHTDDQYRAVASAGAVAAAMAVTADDVCESPAAAAPTAPAAEGMGAFRDEHVMSLVTTSTLARLDELQPHSRFDARRLRMNVVIASEQPGFIDNDWIGRELGLGDGVRLGVIQRDARCVMTTLPQADLPHDPDILKTIARHNNIAVDGGRERPCAGVYADVATGGTLRIGDRVTFV